MITTNGTTVLSPDDIRRIAPSIYAEHPWQGVSDKYKFIPTYKVVDALRENGLHPYSVHQSRTRIEDKAGYTKHLLRFRLDEQPIEVRKVGNLIPEVIIVNSHDVASSFHIHAGMFRLACLNGLVIATGTAIKTRVVHIGDATIDHVLEHVNRIVGQFPMYTEKVAAYQNILLSDAERENFAKLALGLRYDTDKVPFHHVKLLSTRRYADQGKDLFTTMNVVQENLVNGTDFKPYQLGMVHTLDNVRKAHNVRGIHGIDASLELNHGIWQLMENVAAEKLTHV